MADAVSLLYCSLFEISKQFLFHALLQSKVVYMITYWPCPPGQFVSITAMPAYTHSKTPFTLLVTVMYVAISYSINPDHSLTTHS